MTDWPDKKIHNNVIWDIRRHARTPQEWAFTRIAKHDDCVLQKTNRTDGELAIVTARTTGSNWYALTSRRIIGETDNAAFDVSADRITDCDFGRNPKGYNDEQFGIATITHREGMPVQMEYETGGAWMAPEYYMLWWIRKYSILDVLKFDPNVKTTA